MPLQVPSAIFFAYKFILSAFFLLKFFMLNAKQKMLELKFGPMFGKLLAMNEFF